MNENSVADPDNNFSITILRSSPALPDFRAGALPARIFFAPASSLDGRVSSRRVDLRAPEAASG
jgi:hypothetical protein